MPTSPILTGTSIDKQAVYEGEFITVSTNLVDADGDTVTFRILLNGQEIVPWLAYSPTPVAMEHTINALSLNYGLNVIRIEAKDINVNLAFAEFDVYRKSINATYISLSDQLSNYNNVYPFKIGNGNTLLWKYIFNINGYVDSGGLFLNIINGDNLVGNIKVAVITQDWDSTNVTYATFPTQDTINEITIPLTNTTGQQIVNLTPILVQLDTMTNYGLSIYSDDLTIELDVVGNSIAPGVKATLIVLPKNILWNKVTIGWKRAIILREEQFVSYNIYRDINADFSLEEMVYTTNNINEINWIDNNVLLGTYYYRIEIQQVREAYQRNLLDFDTADATLFDNIDNVFFDNGVIKGPMIPAKTNPVDNASLSHSSNVALIDGSLQLVGINEEVITTTPASQINTQGFKTINQVTIIDNSTQWMDITIITDMINEGVVGTGIMLSNVIDKNWNSFYIK